MSFAPVSLKDADVDLSTIKWPTKEESRQRRIKELKDSIRYMSEHKPTYMHYYHGKECNTDELLETLNMELHELESTKP